MKVTIELREPETTDSVAAVALLRDDGMELVKELPAEEAIRFVRYLKKLTDDWLSKRAKVRQDVVLGLDEAKLEALTWLQEQHYGTDDPAVKIWLVSRIVNFVYDPRGSEFDSKIAVPKDSELGNLLSKLYEGHVALDFFEVV